MKNQFASLPLPKKLQMNCYGISPVFDELLQIMWLLTELLNLSFNFSNIKFTELGIQERTSPRFSRGRNREGAETTKGLGVKKRIIAWMHKT